MRSILCAAATATALVASAQAGETQGLIKAAVENPDRKADNRALDEARRPVEVLSFFGVETGMRIVDLGSGGGYFAEILSGAVGPEGEVRAQNRASENFRQNAPALEAHYEKFGNITIDMTEAGEPLPYEDDSVDMVLLSLIIHHLHYDAEAPDATPAASEAIYADIRRILKPGGVFAIIEHKAAEGSSRAESAGWHRIPESTMRADVTAAGFTFDGSAPEVHNNPDDDEKNVWYESGLRWKTTRLVHRYKSPD